MSAKSIRNDEDDKPRTFELIEVIPKGEDKDDYDPVGILYRDPRVDDNGGFVAERGYIVDFRSTREGDKITLMTNWPAEANITRKDLGDYVGDAEHDVYWYSLNICCKKKLPNGKSRNNRGRRKRGGEGRRGESPNSDHA